MTETNPDVNPDGTLRLLTMKQAAELYPYYGVKTLSDAINRGEIEVVTSPGTRHGVKYILPSAMNAWILSRMRRLTPSEE